MNQSQQGTCSNASNSSPRPTSATRLIQFKPKTVTFAELNKADSNDEKLTKLHDAVDNGDISLVWNSLLGISISRQRMPDRTSKEIKELYNKLENHTILHRACKLKKRQDALEMAKVILKWYSAKCSRDEIKLLINETDSDQTKETALHIAAKKRNRGLATLLIRAGADVNIQCANNIEPIDLIYKNIPAVIVSILDSMIEAVDLKDEYDTEFQLKLNYRPIIGYHGPLADEKKPLKETQHLAAALGTLSEKEQSEILGHPSTQLFLQEKLHKMRKLLWLSGIFHTCFYISFICFSIYLYLVKCVNIKEREINCSREGNVAWGFLLFFFLVEIIKEVLKVGCLLQSKKLKYLVKQIKNILSWTLDFMTLSLLCCSGPNINQWEYIVAAIGVPIAFFLIGFQMKTISLLMVYIEVPLKIFFKSLLILITNCCLFIGFPITLLILVPKSKEFSSYIDGLLRISAMINTGDVNYDGFFSSNGTESAVPLPITTKIVLNGMYLLLIIIFVKLIEALVAPDWKELIKQADLLTVAGKLEQINLLERFLLSDTLLKWPGKESWLLKLVCISEPGKEITADKKLGEISKNLRGLIKEVLERNKSI